MRTTQGTAKATLAVVLGLFAGLVVPAVAQQTAPEPAAPPAAAAPATSAVPSKDELQKQFDETQKLIEQMQQRLERINRTAGERDRELDILDSKVGEAVEHIDSGHEEAAPPATAGGSPGMDADIAAIVGDGSGTVEQLRDRLARLAAMLMVERRTVGLLKAERDTLADRLGEDADKRAGTDQDVAARDARIRDLEADGGRLKSSLDAAQAEVARLGKAASDKDADVTRQSARVADLEDRLAKAASAGGGELRPYRADLIGRLRADFGERPGIRIAGDYVIVQAETLFGPGMADTQVVAADLLRQIAADIREVAKSIPSHVDWIVRVDGHTDNRSPRGTGAAASFANNWQLAAARAMAVADVLLREGVPAEHLGIMSFAGNQPLDPRDDEIAQRRNRRIEIRLTQR